MKLKLDDWQKDVLNAKGNVVLRSGRQVGKSTIISIKAAKYAISHKNKTILIISAVERQAQLLFEKVLWYLDDNHHNMIMKGKDRPTKHVISLKNGSKIYSLPTGLSGYGIRGYTVDLLIADEAAFIPEAVWTAVTPMLAVTKGTLILLSTPFGASGYFYECFGDNSFTKFHISSEECPRRDKEFLAREKARMTTEQYAQEYLGEFVDELRQFFPTELIRKCMIIDPRAKNNLTKTLDIGRGVFLGVDLARKGGDETALVSVYRDRRKGLNMCGLDIKTELSIPDNYRLIKHSDRLFDYKRIYIDDGGLGVGVLDLLLEDEDLRRKVVPINNASRSLDWDNSQKRKILKEDLYVNLLKLMESRKIALFEDPNLFQSLLSIQYEYKDGKIRIYGRYTHIAEALIRAVWCHKDKSLNIWIRSI